MTCESTNHDGFTTADPGTRPHSAGIDAEDARPPVRLGRACPAPSRSLCGWGSLELAHSMGAVPAARPGSGGNALCTNGVRLAFGGQRLGHSDHRSSPRCACTDVSERRRPISGRGAQALCRPCWREGVQARRAFGDRPGAHCPGSCGFHTFPGSYRSAGPCAATGPGKGGLPALSKEQLLAGIEGNYTTAATHRIVVAVEFADALSASAGSPTAGPSYAQQDLKRPPCSTKSAMTGDWLATPTITGTVSVSSGSSTVWTNT